MSALPIGSKLSVEIKPGYVLRNGATVIAASARTARIWIILAIHPESADPYITWLCSRPGDGSDTHSGHYFSNLKHAIDDYYERDFYGRDDA